MQIRTEKKTRIWLALAVAIGLHAIILLLPITRHIPTTENTRALIKLRLTTFSPPAVAPQLPVQAAEAAPVSVPEPPKAIVDAQAEIKPHILAASPQASDLEHDPGKMSEPAKRRMTNAILTRQFISEQSEADKLFGKPLVSYSSEPQKAFHYPLRQDMIAMLDQPMPEVPFAYTPGLINFAYDPGVKGNLQRFWDVITPEFGWRTKNGTEFKCVWVLIIGACGWK